MLLGEIKDFLKIYFSILQEPNLLFPKTST